MNIPKYSVTRPVTIVVLYALALGIAATMIPTLAVDLYPSTTQPFLSVYASLSGAGPEDIERNITEPIEKALASTKGLQEMTSNSGFEFSSVNLSFDYGTDIEETMSDVQNVLNRMANSLPDGTSTPQVRRWDMDSMPIMRLVVKGNYTPDQLRLFAEDYIQAQIERIDGVASAAVTGGTRQIIKVEVSLNRLNAFGLSLNDISSALRGQSILVSGGSIMRGTSEYQLLTRQELNDLDEVRRLVVKTVNRSSDDASSHVNRSQVVRLEDVASVIVGYNEDASRVYVDGLSGVYIQVQSDADSNSVKVAQNVRDALEAVNNDLPRGITVEVLSDNTSMINATLQEVYSNAWQGALLAMLILFLFLRNIKAMLVVGLSMPISIVLTLMCMAVFGFTLNLLTMTGLILGLGMIVDGSIVILENIHNYRERGAKPNIATILGSQEMIRAIIASTATTLCVFIPLIIYKNDLEMMGQLFSDLIFTVVISLICSLLVALTLVPALCGPILRLDTRKQKPLKNIFLKKIDNAFESFFKSMENGYKKSLEYCLDHRTLILIFVILLLILSVLQYSNMGMNMFIRTRTDDNITINVRMPPGSTQDSADVILMQLEDIIKAEVQGYTHLIITNRGGANGASGNIQITLPAPANQIDTPTTIQEKLAPYITNFPGSRITFRAGRSMGGSSSVDIALTSRDANALTESADEILNIIMEYLPEIETPEINIEEGSPQLQIEIDRDRASALGVSLSAISSEIRTSMNGVTATTITQGERLVDVDVMLRPEDRIGLPTLDSISVNSSNGSRISLSNVAKIIENRAPTGIRREDQQRRLRISGDIPPGIAATDMQERLKEVVGHYYVPRESVNLEYLGEAEQIREYNLRFLFIIAVAVFLVFGVMASQFESFVDPLIIFFSIPLLLIGVIWIYKIGNEAMSLFSVVGVIALVGVVVNNGIVLVDYTNTLRARGMLVREACIEAGRHRLRPILMTSLTTILGMVPIAFFPGVGADTIQPIGKTFVGGLTISSFMTLFVTPIMYSILNSRHDRKRKAEKNDK
jgi:HAE1 family hydrophobic/amphiphilic exporter-1